MGWLKPQTSISTQTQNENKENLTVRKGKSKKKQKPVADVKAGYDNMLVAYTCMSTALTFN